MTLIETIIADMKSAMKAKDTLRLETLRAVRSEFTALEKSGNEVTEALLVAKLQKMSKARQETAAVYKAAQREDLEAKELAEASIIDTYLPKEMDEHDVRTLILKVMDSNQLEAIKSNMGKIVKLTVEQANGRTNGKTVSTIVNDIITSGNAAI